MGKLATSNTQFAEPAILSSSWEYFASSITALPPSASFMLVSGYLCLPSTSSLVLFPSQLFLSYFTFPIPPLISSSLIPFFFTMYVNCWDDAAHSGQKVFKVSSVTSQRLARQTMPLDLVFYWHDDITYVDYFLTLSKTSIQHWSWGIRWTLSWHHWKLCVISGLKHSCMWGQCHHLRNDNFL